MPPSPYHGGRKKVGAETYFDPQPLFLQVLLYPSQIDESAGEEAILKISRPGPVIHLNLNVQTGGEVKNLLESVYGGGYFGRRLHTGEIDKVAAQENRVNEFGDAKNEKVSVLLPRQSGMGDEGRLKLVRY